MLRDATQRTLIGILDQNEIPYELCKSEKSILLKDVGSRIILRSVDQFERLRGTNLAWFGLDELTYTTEPVWMRLEGRLRDPGAKRLCGFGVWTPRGHDWVYQRFVNSPVEGYKVVVARPFENRFLLAQVPDYYERLKRSYDAGLYEQDVLGSYSANSDDSVYRAFDQIANIRPMQRDFNEPLLWSLDFNVEPMCSIVAQRFRNEIRVIDEIVLHRSCTSDACEEFLKRYSNTQDTVHVYGDASGHRRQTAGTSDYDTVRQIFHRHNRRFELRVPRSNPPVRERVALVNANLGNAEGDRRLFIDPKCRELIKDLVEVRYRSNGEIDKSRDGARTHLSDALGYLILGEVKPDVRLGEQGHRLF
ncbi:MAG: hypothetical protein ABI693_21735 [Bryobacteraceae bacterium]